MGKVITDLTMSLDGFIAGPNDSPDNGLGDGGMVLFDWYSNGSTEFVWPSGTMTSQISPTSAEVLRGALKAGALITGRKTFDIAHGWGGRHPVDVPVFVLTHNVPPEWVSKPGSAMHFVTDGIESAVKQAKAAAGDKDVGVGTATTTQQALSAGLLDEIQVHVMPILLGGGVRLLDHLSNTPIQMETVEVRPDGQVTHMRYRIVK